MREIIKIKDVSKIFSSRKLLCNISSTFFEGQIVGILGDNGSGKTTLIKILCGLVSPDDGSVLINDLDIKKKRAKIMENLGVLLDGSRCLYWRLSAWQNFEYFSGLKGIFGTLAKKRGFDSFHFFDLWEMRNKKVETLSCGMKQKLSIACSLSNNPNIIFFDEPTIGFDRKSQESFKELIKKFSIEGKTILIASHDIIMIQNLCNRIIRIQNGHFVENL